MLLARSITAPKQRGLTLVELLIAMGLGVFLMGGILQVFLGSTKTNTVIEAQVNMQSNARFAYYSLGQHLRMAGYKSTVLPNEWSADVELLTNQWRATGYPPGGIGGEFEAEAFIFGEEGGSGPSGQSDVLHIRSQGEADGSVLACDSTVIPEGIWVQQSFTLDVDGNFVCSVDGGANTLLSQGLEEFQIQFGLSSSPEIAFQASQYLTASTVPAGSWNDVVTVKVAVLAASSNAPLNDAAVGPYQLLDHATAEYTDGKVRAPFEKSFRLRNRQIDSVL